MGFGNSLDLRFRVSVDPGGTAKQMNDLRASVGKSTAAISASISSSFKAARKDSEGLFVGLDQLRIGIDQLSRGSLGALPNFFKAFRAFRADGDGASNTLKILDTALISVGVRSTTAKHLFDEFRERVKSGASGIDADSVALRAAFKALGLDITDALVRPERAFQNLLRLFGQFGPNSREGKAALDALGIGLVDVSKAAGIAGSALAGMGASFTAAGVAAGVAGGAVVVALAAVAVAVVGTVKTIQGMIDTAKEVGTRSKEDFDKLKKSIEAAGFTVTALDRALSQQLTGAISSVKGAMDGLFINVIREAGPALTNVLKQVAGLLKDLEPLAGLVGFALQEAFNLASGFILTFRALIQGAKQDLTNLFLSLSPENLLRGIVQGFEVAAIQTDSLFKRVDKATFDSKAAREKKEKDTTGLILRELDIQLKAAKRVFDEETEAAERAGERREITFEAMTAALIAAEEKFFTEQKRIFAEEKKAVEASTKGKEERALRLAEIREEELQALDDYSRRIREIGDDNTDREKKAVESLIELIQEAVKARVKLQEELSSLAIESREVQRAIDDLNLERLRESPLPAHQRQAVLENLRIRTDAETDRAEQVRISLERQKRELIELAATQQEREQIEKLFNARLEAEQRRHNAAKNVLNREATRELERQNPLSARSLLGETFANLSGEQELGFVKSIAGSFAESFGEISKSAGNFKTQFVAAIQAGTGALQSLLATWIQTGKTGPAAARKFVSGVLSALSQLWLAKAIAELAEGFAALFFNPADAAAHFQASGLYFAAMAAAGLTGRAVAGNAFSQSAGGGGGGGTQNQEPRQININRGGSGETLGVGIAGQDVSATNLFAQYVQAVNRNAAATEQLASRIDSIPEHEIIRRGADGARAEIANAVLQQSRESAEFVNGFGRILMGPA